MTVTNAEKLACAERELKMRQRVYARWVDAGKLTSAKAAHEIACMEAIIADYRILVDRERTELLI